MTVFALCTVVIAFAMGAMGLGRAWGRPPLGRGCGSEAAACAACTRPCRRDGDATPAPGDHFGEDEWNEP